MRPPKNLNLDATKELRGTPTQSAEKDTSVAPLVGESPLVAVSLNIPSYDRKMIGRAINELHAGAVLSRGIRDWLANALDERAESEIRLVAKRKKGGRPESDYLSSPVEQYKHLAGEYVVALRLSGMPQKGAIFEAAVLYGLHEDTVEKAFTKFNKLNENNNYCIPIAPIGFFEDSQVPELEQRAYDQKWQVYADEYEASRSSEEIDDENIGHAENEIEQIAKKLGAVLAERQGAAARAWLCERMAEALTQRPSGYQTNKMIVWAAECLVQCFLEKLEQQLNEELSLKLGEQVARLSRE